MIKTAEPLQVPLAKNCKVEVWGIRLSLTVCWLCAPHKNDVRTTRDSVCRAASCRVTFDVPSVLLFSQHLLILGDGGGLVELVHQRVGVLGLSYSSSCLVHNCHIIFGDGQL